MANGVDEAEHLGPVSDDNVKSTVLPDEADTLPRVYIVFLVYLLDRFWGLLLTRRLELFLDTSKNSVFLGLRLPARFHLSNILH